MGLMIAGAIVVVGVLFVVLAFGGWLNPWFTLVGLILCVAGALYGVDASTIVRVKRIKGDFVFLKGISPPFLETLPEFPGQG